MKADLTRSTFDPRNFNGALTYVGGEMAVNDLAVVGWIDSHFYALHQIVPIGCAAFILVVGKLKAARRQSAV